MNTQRSFFDAEFAADQQVKRMSRSTDPATSHAAAASLELTLVRARALEVVRRNPGKTAREHDTCEGWDVHKRLAELERMKLVRRSDARMCTVTRRNAATWYAR